LAANEELVVGQDRVLLSCLQQLKLISGEAAPREISDIEFPTLPQLITNEVSSGYSKRTHSAKVSL
jgi:hypothetical protein